jgi:uncharacterized membrane protein
MILMVGLRRLPRSLLLVVGVGWFLSGEAITSLVWTGTQDVGLPAALTLAPRMDERALIVYPVLPWLAMMVLGWVFGHHLRERERAGSRPPLRLLLVASVVALATFAVVRGARGYGNMFLLPDDDSLVQWLHVSKYPPGLSFAALELGLMGLVLAAFLRFSPPAARGTNGLLLVLGQTALFYYLMHFTVLGVSARVAGGFDGGLLAAYVVAAVVIALLYPLCRVFRAYKQRHPESFVRFV